ncbi:MAG: YqcI/YcgG family protein [Pseudomonadota bacterium]
MRLYTKTSFLAFPEGSWEQKAAAQFQDQLTSEDRPFPCTLGVAGLNADQLRYSYIDQDVGSEAAARSVAAALQAYLPVARSFGKNTSLVIFFNEFGDLGTDAYEELFWNLLNAVHRLDARAWPNGISKDPEHRNWEFSFAGEAIFVVCNTPSHKKRKSRYGNCFTLTFQPRWVFDGVIGKGAPNSDKIKSTIRDRLDRFDDVTVSPHLGAFGDENNREWKQYYLDDGNAKAVGGCPFRQSHGFEQPTVQKTQTRDLPTVIGQLLPPTGSVEVQVDTPCRVHMAHMHPTDETLHIVEGEITFQVGAAELVCGPGDRLLLPANTEHASVAGEGGCTYVIATRVVENDARLARAEG